MTRIEKNSDIYLKSMILKLADKLLDLLKIYLKTLLRDSVCLIVGVLYIIYLIIKNFDNLVIKLFLKIPRYARATIIYLTIFVLIFLIFQPNEVIVYKNKIITKEIEVIPEDMAKVEEQFMEEPINTCKLSEIECKIYNKAIEQGLTNEQAYIILSISKHETGRWTSNAFINKHNLGGIMCSTGIKQYNTLDEGIEAFVNLLKNRYFAQGLDTIEKIQPVYCPVGAANDPKGLNKYWLSTVTQFYNEYTK